MVTGSWGGELADPESDYRLLLFLQQADGSLAMPIRLALTPPYALGRLHAADLNRDGISDLILGGSGLSIFFGSANGLQAGPVLHGEANAEVAADFTVGDMDLDGRPDIVAWMAGTSAGGSYPSDMIGITIFYGDGQGGAARRRFLRQSIYAGALAWIDVNRDGRADLVSTWVKDSTDSGVAIFHHDGVDAFHAPQIVRLGRGGFGRGITTGDFDANGYRDIVLSREENAPRAELAWLQQTPEGGLKVEKIWRTYDIPSELAGRDIDGDGRDDLIIHHSGWSSIGYQRQIDATAGATLDTEVKYYVRTSNRVYGGLATGDLNGDGCTDVALSDNNHGLQVLHATGCLSAPAMPPPLLPPSNAVSGSGAPVSAIADGARSTGGNTTTGTSTRIVQDITRMARAGSARIQRMRARELAAWSAAVLMMLAIAKLWPRLRRG